MITLDACAIIHASQYHAGAPSNKVDTRGAAQLLGQRRLREYMVPESVIGEVLSGVKTEREFNIILAYLRRFKCINTTFPLLKRAAKLINAYSDRAPRKFRKDAVAYASASSAKASAFCTFDRGFIGAGNRKKLKDACASIRIYYVPAHSPSELLVMTHINPPPKPAPVKKSRKKKMDFVEAWRARADAKAKAAVGPDPMDQMVYFIGVARAFGFGAKSNA